TWTNSIYFKLFCAGFRRLYNQFCSVQSAPDAIYRRRVGIPMTIFYWAWAIAWSPFVGAFVARVSRGRTIREFVTGVMVVPPAIACVWIAVFGGTALYSDLNNGTQIAEAVNADVQ